MKKMQTKCVVLSALLVGACYPVEQAPLVYSSRQQMGVNVSGGTSDTPGLELSIGYKGVDAAFVPVMVAKHCPEVSARECSNLTYQLQKILGSNDVGDESSVDGARISELQGAINAHEAEVTRLEDDLKAVKSQIADLERLQSELRAFDAEKAAIDQAVTASNSATRDQEERLKEIVARQDALNTKLASRDALQATLARKEIELDNARLRLREDRNRLKELQDRRNQSRKDKKEDALSVFGSFEGSADAAKDNASLGVGKVFSTGVASQHLTQGLGRGAVISLRTKCIGTVVTIAKDLPPAQKEKLLGQLGQICMESVNDSH